MPPQQSWKAIERLSSVLVIDPARISRASAQELFLARPHFPIIAATYLSLWPDESISKDGSIRVGISVGGN